MSQETIQERLVGQAVDAKTKEGWRRGSVTAIHEDGTLDVTFEHGSVGKNWKPSNVKTAQDAKDVARAAHEAAADAEPRASALFSSSTIRGSPLAADLAALRMELSASDAQFSPGNKVEVHSRTRNMWIPATITSVKINDGKVHYTVLLTEHKREALVPEEDVRLQGKPWAIRMSVGAERTKNPIRKLVDEFKLDVKIPGKPLIPLSIGDPQAFPNLPVHKSVIDAICAAANEGGKKNHGYAPSVGLPSARKAIAKKFSRPGYDIDFNNIILTSGCSDALNIAIAGLVSEGDNILLPRPGFTLYTTICERYGIEPRFYDLVPEQGWEADLESMRKQIDDRTRAVLTNNPSNPCGSVFTAEHIKEIVGLCEEFRLPIIADEIYANMVFKGHKYVAFDEVSTEVPVISTGGISKQYVAPGWRLGWLVVHDRHNRLGAAKQGFFNLSTVILGPNSLVQSALPAILHETPDEYYTFINESLQTNAEIVYNAITQIKGLTPVRPGGAMYLMVGIDIGHFPDYPDDVEFSKALVVEQAVFVLPGGIFGAPNFFRVVICPPPDKLNDAMARLSEFCEAHYQ